MTVSIKIKQCNSFMKELGIHRYYEFEHQIIRGISSRSLSKILKSEGFYPDVKMESLATKIRCFRRETILPKTRRLLEIESKTNVTDADRAISEQRNVALELNKLIAIQHQRLRKCLRLEDEQEELRVDATRELKLLWKIYVSVGQFQIKSGLISSVNKFGNNYYNDILEKDRQVQELLSDSEKQRQLACATQKALKLLATADINEFD